MSCRPLRLSTPEEEGLAPSLEEWAVEDGRLCRREGGGRGFI